MPTEPVDIFADAFRVYVGAFGCMLTFSLSNADQQAVTPPGTTLPSDRVATIRLAPELLKGMAFMLRQQIIAYEREEGKIVMPEKYIAAAVALVGADSEAWNRCWEYT